MFLGHPVCVQKCLKDFTVDALTISAGSLFPESVLATAGITFPLMEPCAGWMGENGLHGEFQKTMGDLEHGY